MALASRAHFSGLSQDIDEQLFFPLQRKDASGTPVPAHFIKTIIAQCNGRTVFEAETGTSISKDPFISFKFKNGNKGDKVVVTWNDNKGDSRTDEVVIT